MLTLDPKSFILYDNEETTGEATSDDEIDMSEISDEDMQTALDESLESEDTEETSTEEPTSEEPTSEEPSDEEVSEEDDTAGKILHAGRYYAPDELATKYAESSTEGKRLAKELRQTREELERLKTQRPAAAPPEEEPTAESAQPVGKFNREEYDRLYYEDGPGAAYEYANRVQMAEQQAKQSQEQAQSQQQDAETFNKSLALTRAKELLIEDAKKSGNQLLIDKYSNENFIPSIEDIEANEKVLSQWDKEAQFVLENLTKPIIAGDRIIAKVGKLNKDAFKIASRALNYEQAIDKTRIETAENTARAITTEGKPSAKILTPKGESKAEIKVKWTDTENEDEIPAKARQMQTNDLDAELKKRGLI